MVRVGWSWMPSPTFRYLDGGAGQTKKAADASQKNETTTLWCLACFSWRLGVPSEVRKNCVSGWPKRRICGRGIATAASSGQGTVPYSVHDCRSVQSAKMIVEIQRVQREAAASTEPKEPLEAYPRVDFCRFTDQNRQTPPSLPSIGTLSTRSVRAGTTWDRILDWTLAWYQDHRKN